MNRSAAREPRYKQPASDQTFRRRDSRCHDSREVSEDSTSEEEEESSDRYTEESDDAGDGHCPRRRSRHWEALARILDRQKKYGRIDERDSLVLNSYLASVGASKRDKITQKNLISPLPSFLTPPIYREVSGAPHYKLSTIKSSRAPVNGGGKSSTGASKMEEADEDVDACTRHRQRDHRRRKSSERQRTPLGSKTSKGRSSQRVLACLHEGAMLDSSGKHSKTTSETETSKKSREATTTATSTTTSTAVGAPRGPSEGKPRILAKCLDCVRLASGGSDRKPRRYGIRGSDSEVELRVHDSFFPKSSTDEGTSRKPQSDSSGKVREKLVYVVEEDGNDVTKLETDLFSVNEILAIKKDLLELSEFAKKLKKLKEMKRESDKGKRTDRECHCKPVADLLRNVNRRIEALEARQEELEKGAAGREKKGGAVLESKISESENVSTDSPPKTPVMAKKSAMTSTPSFPKTEMIVSRAEGFSNNSEIVNELMDIKTQLKRLEKRRLSKEASAGSATAGVPKSTQKESHAIAVFSSRTYILASENLEANKPPVEDDDGKAQNATGVADFATEETSRRARVGKTKENVSNWLKGVSPVRGDSGNEGGAFGAVAEEKAREVDATGDVFQEKRPNCSQAASHDSQDQEPPKNRATEREAGIDDGNFLASANHKAATPVVREFIPAVECRRCYVTPSGRVFTLKGSGKTRPRGAGPEGSLDGIRRSASIGSVPSAVAVKETVRGRKGRVRETPNANTSTSKSMQELSSLSNSAKDKKTLLNMNAKSQTKRKSPPPRDKNQKETKNEMVKQGMTPVGEDCLTPASSASRFVGSVNLEANSSEDAPGTKNENERKIGSKMCSVGALARAYYQYYCRDKSRRIKENAKEKEKKKKEKERKEKRCKTDCRKQSKSSKCKRDKSSKKSKKPERGRNRRRESSSSSSEEDEWESSPVGSSVQVMYTTTKTGHGYCHSGAPRTTAHHRRKGQNPCKSRWTPAGSRWHHPDQCQNLGCGTCYDHGRVRQEVASDAGCSHRSDRQRIKICESSDHGLKDHRTLKTKEEQPCAFKSFFKNLRSFYPRLSVSNLNPWRGYCEKESNRKAQKDESDSGGEEEEEEEEYYYHEEYKPEHLQNCKCVRVYLQTQGKQDWPGVRPFPKSPEESISESTSETTESSESEETESESRHFGGRSQAYYVGHCQEEETKKKKKHKNDSEECHEKRKKKRREKCVCDKCGHVHKKKRPKKKKEKRKKKKKKKKRKDSESECSEHHGKDNGKEPCNGGHPKEPDNGGHAKEPCNGGHPKEPAAEPQRPQPRRRGKFNFFSGYCPSKPKTQKSRKSESSAFGRMCRDRFCKSTKEKPKKGKKHQETPEVSGSCSPSSERHRGKSEDSEKTESSHSARCKCTPKINEIEERLDKLEKSKSNRSQTSSSEDDSHKKKKKKRKKKKRKKKKRRDSSESETNENSEEKHKEKHKEGEEVNAYYCTCVSAYNDPGGTTTGDKTTTTTKFTTEGSKTTVSSKTGAEHRWKDGRLKKRLSSFHSFLKSLGRSKRGKRLLGDRPDALLDDCSKSSPVPKMKEIHDLKEEPNYFFKKSRSGRRKRKEKKEKKEKVPKSKEKRKS